MAGPYFTVDDARLWTVPEEPLPIWMSAFGEQILPRLA